MFGHENPKLEEEKTPQKIKLGKRFLQQCVCVFSSPLNLDFHTLKCQMTRIYLTIRQQEGGREREREREREKEKKKMNHLEKGSETQRTGRIKWCLNFDL